MHRTHPPTQSSAARIGKTWCTDVISSAVWFTSTGELHERIYAPHTSAGAVALSQLCSLALMTEFTEIKSATKSAEN